MMKKINRKTILYLACMLLTGFLAALAFPPFEYAGAPIWFALVPFLLVLRHLSTRSAFRHGLLAGLTFWIITLGWFPAIIKNEGPWFLVLLGWAGLAVWCSLFWGFFAWASVAFRTHWDGRIPGARILSVLIVDPILWMGLEWVRSWLFSGFAWNFLGVSQAMNPPVIQIASIFGVFGVSGLVMLANGALTALVERMLFPILQKLKNEPMFPLTRRDRLAISMESALPFLVLVGFWMWGAMRVTHWDRAHGKDAASTWRVTLIQANMPCIFFGDQDRARRQLMILKEQTQLANLSRPDLIVWSETAIPGCMPPRPGLKRFLQESMGTNGAPLLAGGEEMELCEPSSAAPKGQRFYNSAFLLDASGNILGTYRKQHLVPFGEYIPLDKLIPALQDLAPTGVSCFPGLDSAVMTLTRQGTKNEQLKIGSLICFEDTIPALSRNAIRAGADVLALMTNDTWFNHSCEPIQHQHQAIFRSVENGRPMIRASNSGVTCTVDPVGRTKSLEADGKQIDFHGFLSSRIVTVPGEYQTFFTRFGNIPLAILLTILFLSRCVTSWIDHQKKNKQKKTEEESLPDIGF